LCFAVPARVCAQADARIKTRKQRDGNAPQRPEHDGEVELPEPNRPAGQMDR
jgi:hypothetical protein